MAIFSIPALRSIASIFLTFFLLMLLNIDLFRSRHLQVVVYLLVVRYFEAVCELFQLLQQFLYCHRICLHVDNFRNGSLTLNFEFEVWIA